MNEYNFNVKFEKGRISSNLKKLVQNDYNSTKINFTFDKEGRKLFKMLYPDGSAYITQIDNDELIFGSGVLSQDGTYEVEIALYTEDGRLTDYATTKFEVRAELIQSDEIVEIDDRLPILDSLINDVNKIKEDAENGVFDGEQGLPGENGYTPVRGIDYWTEEDVKEIKSYIDENGGGEVSWNDLKDKPFGEEEKLTTLMDEVKLTDENKHDLVQISIYADKLKLGEEYLVIYNGTEYRCTAISGKVDNSFNDSILIGNGILADETNTENREYPFCICNGFYESFFEVYWTDDEAVIEVKHIKYITKQLDQKYIPKVDISYNDLKDKPFGEEITSYICIPKGSTVLNGNYYYPENGYRGIFSDTKYLVNFNDVEYLCETSGIYNYERYIGNPHYLDNSLESNEYPFCIWADSYNEMYIVYFDGDVDTTAVISLDELEIEIKQIDTKYIPNTIATNEYVDKLIGDINAQLASLTEVE